MPDQMIVIADDDPAILQLMELVFLEEGLVVLTARDGQEALNLVARERPAAVVLDLRMPILDGYAVVSNLRRSERTHAIPIVAISAERSGKKLSHLQVDAFLSKPFELDDLVNTVKTLLASKCSYQT
ncbi:MAG: response regulator [Chloroflexi bacterium]|nr:response regulator [Chloroflexota bacterium]